VYSFGRPALLLLVEV